MGLGVKPIGACWKQFMMCLEATWFVAASHSTPMHDPGLEEFQRPVRVCVFSSRNPRHEYLYIAGDSLSEEAGHAHGFPNERTAFSPPQGATRQRFGDCAESAVNALPRGRC